MKQQITQALNLLSFVAVIAFFLSLILKIWTDEETQYILNRILLTSLSVFAFVVVFHGFFIHEDEEKEV